MLIELRGDSRYCTPLVLADYLRLREAGTVEEPALDRLFVEKLDRASLGQWNEFWALRALRPPQLSSPAVLLLLRRPRECPKIGWPPGLRSTR
jgi:hypothetical protein